MAKPKAKSTGKTASKPELPSIAPVASTGDPALDAQLTALMSWDAETLAAMKAVIADHRPEVVLGLRNCVTALSDAIIPVSVKIKSALYMEMEGEVQHRLRLLGVVLEALMEHHDADAEVQIVELMRYHKEERVRLQAARALLGQRVSSGNSGPWDAALRASNPSLEAVVRWGEARPAKDVVAKHFVTTAKQYLER